MPRLTLKVDYRFRFEIRSAAHEDTGWEQTLYNALAVFQFVIICCVAFDEVPYFDVYSQSAATPM